MGVDFNVCKGCVEAVYEGHGRTCFGICGDEWYCDECFGDGHVCETCMEYKENYKEYGPSLEEQLIELRKKHQKEEQKILDLIAEKGKDYREKNKYFDFCWNLNHGGCWDTGIIFEDEVAFDEHGKPLTFEERKGKEKFFCAIKCIG